MNDNKKPYSFRETTDDIEEFIVPVAENILLNAEQLNPDKTISELKKLFLIYASFLKNMNITIVSFDYIKVV